MAYVLGIDLGTSYSAAAVGHLDGRAEMFQLGQRSAAIPSLVVVRPDGEVLTGEAAERRAVTEPTRTAREFKRRLGDPVPVVIGGTPYGTDALLAILLRSIVRQVSREMGSTPEHVVITHPASYGPYKLDLLRAAARQAEIPAASFVSEPVAAAVHYASLERVPRGAKVAVYDFGGGTFDATILETTAEGFEARGTPEGLERLGGVDFDEAIFRHVVNAIGAPIANLDASDPAAQAGLARLREECRRAKEALSADSDAVIPVSLPGIQTEVRITRAEFEAMIEPRIAETVAALERAARSAAVGLADVDRILLVGGTSRIPRIAERVRAATGRPVAVDVHPKHSVALGAARIGVEEHLRRALSEHEPRGGPVVIPAAAAAESVLPAPSTSGPSPAVHGDAGPLGGIPGDRGPQAQGRAGRQPSGGRGGSARWLLPSVGVLVLVVAAGAVLASGILTDRPAASPAATARLAAPTLPPAPSALPTFGADPSAAIVAVSVEGDRYRVEFETTGFQPASGGTHVHFFWDIVPPEEAGAGGEGPYIVYDGGSPFTELGPAARPRRASAICIIVANPDHSVIPASGSCAPLP